MPEPRRNLILIDSDSGERFEEGCPDCEAKEEIAKGLERKIRGLILENAALRKDAEREARDSGLWPAAVRLFVIWQKATGRTRSKFRFDRFTEIEPFLRGYDPDKHELALAEGPPQNPLEECAAAIIGRASDHFTAERKNGSTVHYNEWTRIFKDSKEFDESQARRPKDWREQVRKHDPRPPESEPAPKPARKPFREVAEQTALLKPLDRPQV